MCTLLSAQDSVRQLSCEDMDCIIDKLRRAVEGGVGLISFIGHSTAKQFGLKAVSLINAAGNVVSSTLETLLAATAAETSQGAMKKQVRLHWIH